MGQVLELLVNSQQLSGLVIALLIIMSLYKLVYKFLDKPKNDCANCVNNKAIAIINDQISKLKEGKASFTALDRVKDELKKDNRDTLIEFKSAMEKRMDRLEEIILQAKGVLR